MTLSEQLIAAIDAIDDCNHDAFQQKLKAIQQLLTRLPNDALRNRKTLYHLSASVLLFKENQLLFVEHPYQKEWLLPAGHVEPKESPIETALREFTEETGFGIHSIEEITLMDVNVIPIPRNSKKEESAHHHIDFRYLLQLKELERIQQAELPLTFLNEEDAPDEFKAYFKWLD